jgi:hypothetical protein
VGFPVEGLAFGEAVDVAVGVLRQVPDPAAA